MPKVDVNAKRGYEASVPVEKIWSKLEDGTIDKEFCIPLGENKNKEDRFINLKQSFHILSAGAALSGVGMFRRVALATLIKFNKPEDLKLILIDPLKISFFDFKNIDPYLVYPVITENKKALETLGWARQEIERRYNILVEKKFMNIASYNEKNPDNKIPKIVIMITELGELIDFNKKETELALLRIGLMAKALGIHFIISTQRLSENFITPIIKASIGTRIAFHTGSKEGSLAILSREGAEDLLGQGDMIVDDPSFSERMQGYCLEEEN